jgi:hypothetical protein
MGLLRPYVDELPPDEEPGVFHLRIDPFGRRQIVVQFPIPGTQDHEQFYLRMVNDTNPDFEIPDGGGLLVAGRPVESPIAIMGGSFDVPVGEDERHTKQNLGGIQKTFLLFDQTTIQYGYAVIPSPESYSGGPIAARFYFYQAGVASGNVGWEIRVRSATDGQSIIAMTHSYTAAADKAVTTTNKLYRTDWTDYFDPSQGPERGDELHIEMRRNTGIGSNVAEDSWLSGIQIAYPRDRATARPLGT